MNGSADDERGAECAKSGGTPFQKEKEAMEAMFEPLEAAAEALNSTADRANEMIRTVNERFQAIGAGLEFWPSEPECLLDSEILGEPPADPFRVSLMKQGKRERFLGFGKLEGIWQMGIRTETAEPRDLTDVFGWGKSRGGHERRPLLAADRDLRIEAAGRLPAFIKAYAARLSERAEQLRKKLEQ